jgi:hypothetical protein
VDDDCFDAMTRVVAGGSQTRRAALRLLAGAGLGLLAARLGLSEDAEAKKTKRTRRSEATPQGRLRAESKRKGKNRVGRSRSRGPRAAPIGGNAPTGRAWQRISAVRGKNAAPTAPAAPKTSAATTRSGATTAHAWPSTRAVQTSGRAATARAFPQTSAAPTRSAAASVTASRETNAARGSGAAATAPAHRSTSAAPTRRSVAWATTSTASRRTSVAISMPRSAAGARSQRASPGSGLAGKRAPAAASPTNAAPAWSKTPKRASAGARPTASPADTSVARPTRPAWEARAFAPGAFPTAARRSARLAGPPTGIAVSATPEPFSRDSTRLETTPNAAMRLLHGQRQISADYRRRMTGQAAVASRFASSGVRPASHEGIHD